DWMLDEEHVDPRATARRAMDLAWLGLSGLFDIPQGPASADRSGTTSADRSGTTSADRSGATTSAERPGTDQAT
ncbi:MAG: hypothetical protein ACRDUA_09290, partial [Micromonosporaceae bacterium]